jgi:putative methionine-R-sulfoxide reductase with GAF domain
VLGEQLLQLASSKIHRSGLPHSHVYMYLRQPDETLAVVAYNGKSLDADNANVTSGNSSRAFSEKANCYTPQVQSSDRHLLHHSTTQSELVVLIRRYDEVIGAIGIECGLPEAFNDVEQAAVVAVADALAALL